LNFPQSIWVDINIFCIGVDTFEEKVGQVILRLKNPMEESKNLIIRGCHHDNVRGF
jgi:hypothetical protein